MTWKEITDESTLAAIKDRSADTPQVIFKHSTRCSISSMAKNRLERADVPAGVDFNFLDLIKHRDLSDLVAEQFSVEHESPQILLIRNGKCVYDESHTGISMAEIAEQALSA